MCFTPRAMKKPLLLSAVLLSAFVATSQGCGSSATRSGFDEGAKDAGVATDDDGTTFGDDDDGFGDAGKTTIDPGTSDPATCDEAAKAKTYVGCDYWPTVTPNPVWSLFDFAVIVANGGKEDAEITVTGPGGTNQKVTVAAGSLDKIYLPWVKDLKGSDSDQCGSAPTGYDSRIVKEGAFHLVSSVPVTVYQFNALEYAGKGGAPGKSWSSCPGNNLCVSALSAIGCFSFSNDASLLLPSTAMTGTYRFMGYAGNGSNTAGQYIPPTATLTGTTDNTKVTVKLSSKGSILGGSGVSATAASGSLSLTLNAGDVVRLTGAGGTAVDLSGSLITADKPIQVLSGVPCITVPADKAACDHIEESVMPAETLGKHYVVAQPSGPAGATAAQSVRFYGNVDGTKLTYDPAKPSGCPSTINAGEVVDCGIVASDFDVTGDHEFGIQTFMQGGSVVDPQPGTSLTPSKGDPSQSAVVAVEQFRMKYVFLAPDDYDVNYANIIVPVNTKVTLDGKTISTKALGITKSYGVLRVELGTGNNGSHTLTADKRVGIQVLGYGSFTSYQYPGGLNLDRIANAPVN